MIVLLALACAIVALSYRLDLAALALARWGGHGAD